MTTTDPTTRRTSNIQALIAPRSVAVVGASGNAAKPGNRILRNIRDGGYQGALYPINPKAGVIEELPAFASVTDVPAEIDLAIIVLARQHVEPALLECVRAGVRAVVVVTAGFAEGDEWGRETQRRLTALADEAGIAAIGPNTLGHVNKEIDFLGSFVPFDTWHDGPVALIAQTGVYAGAVLQELMNRPTQRIGVRFSVDIGNRVGVSEIDLLDEFARRGDIRVVGCYLEQIADMRAFLARAAEVKRDKPVVVLKPGRTQRGARASASHTGAVATDDSILDQLFAQHGIVRAEDNEDFTELLRAFSYCQVPPAGRRVGVITYSGALGSMAVDAVAAAGLSVPDFTSRTLETLGSLMPDWQTPDNPADLWSAAESDPGRAARTCFPAVLADDNIDQFLAVLLAVPNVDFEGIREVFAQMREQRPDVPLHLVMHGALGVRWREELEGLGVLVHTSAREAARAMAMLAWYGEVRDAMPSAHARRGQVSE